QRKYDEAIDYARRALERQRDCEGAYLVLGRAWFASDRWQEAAATVEQAIEVSGDDYNVYVPYILALECLNQKEAAYKLRERQAEVLEKQLRMVPEDVRARILLSSDHAALGRRDKAVEELEKAVALRSNDTNVLYNAACTYGRMEMKSEALAMLKKAKEVGFPNLDWAARDPDLTCLRGQPEFLRLLADDHKS
ncbi:MAG: TPR end-of-group domain-containing protein, partial [Terriglobales bacterium]